MNALIVALAFLPLLFSQAATHSMMAWPESTSPNVCRLGGNPNPGTCPGPCDVKAIEGGFANFGDPSHSAAVFYRGQRIKVKYQRNNHGPGGFVRHTLVPLDKMMDKRVHARNAFSYSCFGATPVRAKRSEMSEDRWGFSLVGNDGKGKKHTQATGYYVSEVTIPPVVPDGFYIFGWVWYGGTGGDVTNRAYREEPWWKGYFSDYWSCSFVQVKGGKPLEMSYTPVFKNDMGQFSREGCMSANDAPGICTHEPCIVYGKYQKPKPFKHGDPPSLTPAHFMRQAVDGRSGTIGTQTPPEFVLPKSPRVPKRRKRGYRSEMRFREKKAACKCIGQGVRCGKMTARKSKYCKRWIKEEEQTMRCQQSCCSVCRLGSEETAGLCINAKVRAACKL